MIPIEQYRKVLTTAAEHVKRLRDNAQSATEKANWELHLKSINENLGALDEILATHRGGEK